MSEIDLNGITRPAAITGIASCPNACTAARCVISTIDVCKHPCITPDRGCGPITMANRARARKHLGIVVLPAEVLK